MVERDVVLGKLAIIDRCTRRIREVRSERRSELQPLDVEEIVILNLQRAVQAAIDLAAHVVAAEGYGLPDSLAGTFSLLEQRGVIGADLAERLRRMVGFRNIVVHDYRVIDPRIVDSIVENSMTDLRAFASQVLVKFELSEAES